MFVKGDPRINRKGRPLGATEKPWLRPEYWHNLVVSEWKKLEPNERATIAMKGFSTVLPRVIGPQTPDESVRNAEAALKMLKMLQEVSRNGSNPGTGAGSDPSRLDDGRPTSQTSETSAPSV